MWTCLSRDWDKLLLGKRIQVAGSHAYSSHRGCRRQHHPDCQCLTAPLQVSNTSLQTIHVEIPLQLKIALVLKQNV